MDKTKRLWLLTFLLAALVVGGGYAGLVSRKAGEASEVRGNADAAVAANRALEVQIATLKKQAKQLPKEQARLTEIAQKLPSNPALPAFIRSLSDAAEKANIEVISLKPEKPQPLTTTVGATTAAGPTVGGRTSATTEGTGTTGTGTTGTGTTGTGTTGTGTTGTGSARTTAGTVAAPAPQLSFIPVEIVVQGSYADIQRLLGSFEEFARAMLVSGVKIEKAKHAGPAGGAAAPKIRTVGTLLEMKVTGRLFMQTAPATSAKTPGVTPKTAPTSAASK